MQNEGLSKAHPDCIFVVLGEQHPVLVADSNLLHGLIQPNFKNIEAKISPHYTFFNKSTTNYLLNSNLPETTLSKGVSPLSGSAGKDFQRRRASETSSKAGDIENSLKILDLIQKALTIQIINYLPKNPIFLDEAPQVN